MPRSESEELKRLEKWKLPEETTYDNARERRRKHMQEIASKAVTSESALKGARTKTKKNKNYFKEIGSVGGKASKKRD